jgi:hypothetical protein
MLHKGHLIRIDGKLHLVTGDTVERLVSARPYNPDIDAGDGTYIVYLEGKSGTIPDSFCTLYTEEEFYVGSKIMYTDSPAIYLLTVNEVHIFESFQVIFADFGGSVQFGG